MNALTILTRQLGLSLGPVIILVCAELAASAQVPLARDYLDPSLPVAVRVEHLLGQMTLAEKVGQMCMSSARAADAGQLAREGMVGAFVGVAEPAGQIDHLQQAAVEKSRLGIPILFGLDVVHGYSTIFPIPLAEASTWNPDLIRRCAEIAAKEASAQGIRWTMSPMVDIARDPRWGRIAEGAGEDPFLDMAMARAMVQGYQGPELSPESGMVACVKHFVGYGAAEGGRDYNTTEISERTLRDVYLPPFRAAVEAGAGTVMSAFNDLDGIPASADTQAIRGILKGEWSFKGVVRADANADAELVNHGVAGNASEAADKGITAGLDMAFVTYRDNLGRLVREGKVPLSLVDDAVRRLLTIKFAIGLFEHPRVDLDRAQAALLLPEYREVAREAARESIVLLKNEGQLLPLDKNIKCLAVIGPLADGKQDMLGCWNGMGRANSVVTLLEGIKAKVPPTTKVLYVKGSGITNGLAASLAAALAAARQADVIVLAVGESASMTGEAASRSSLDIPDPQQQLVRAVAGLGKPVVEVLMNGRPLSIQTDADEIPAIVEAWFPGTEGGNAIADVLFGDYNPGGKLPVTFPRTVGQVPMYYDHMNTGRPASTNRFTARYIDLPWTPLYPFGFGLSYTTFAFSDLKVTADPAVPDRYQVTVRLRNTGLRNGTETAQLYLRQSCASVTRPVEQLEGFEKVELAPGQSKTVRFTLTPFELSFYNVTMQRVVEAGPLEVMVGDRSDAVISQTVQIAKTIPLEPPVSRTFDDF